MMRHRYFERAILAIIVLSSIKLAFDTYVLDYPKTSLIVRFIIIYRIDLILIQLLLYIKLEIVNRFLQINVSQ